MVEIKEFGSEEVSELQRYIQTNVHNTVLQKLYVLSENPEDKSTTFVIVYRIIQSCQRYGSTQELRNRLEQLLQEAQEVYEEIYPLVLEYSNKKLEFGKGRLLRKIISIFTDPAKNQKINKIIDAFLVFGEKIELTNIDTVMGLDLESDHAKGFMKEIREVVKKENI